MEIHNRAKASFLFTFCFFVFEKLLPSKVGDTLSSKILFNGNYD